MEEGTFCLVRMRSKILNVILTGLLHVTAPPLNHPLWLRGCDASVVLDLHHVPHCESRWAQVGEKWIFKRKLILSPAEGIIDVEMPNSQPPVPPSRKTRYQYLSLNAIS